MSFFPEFLWITSYQHSMVSFNCLQSCCAYSLCLSLWHIYRYIYGLYLYYVRCIIFIVRGVIWYNCSYRFLFLTLTEHLTLSRFKVMGYNCSSRFLFLTIIEHLTLSRFKVMEYNCSSRFLFLTITEHLTLFTFYF